MNSYNWEFKLEKLVEFENFNFNDYKEVKILIFTYFFIIFLEIFAFN